MSVLSGLLDALGGRAPSAQTRRRMRPHVRQRNPRERKSLSAHVEEDEYWREQFVVWRDRISTEVFDMRVDIHGIRRLLIIIVLLLLGSKGIDLTLLGGL